MTSPVTLDLEGVPLKTTLRLMLKQLGLTYTVKDGLLTITSEDVRRPADRDPRLPGRRPRHHPALPDGRRRWRRHGRRHGRHGRRHGRHGRRYGRRHGRRMGGGMGGMGGGMGMMSVPVEPQSQDPAGALRGKKKQLSGIKALPPPRRAPHNSAGPAPVNDRPVPLPFPDRRPTTARSVKSVEARPTEGRARRSVPASPATAGPRPLIPIAPGPIAGAQALGEPGSLRATGRTTTASTTSRPASFARRSRCSIGSRQVRRRPRGPPGLPDPASQEPRALDVRWRSALAIEELKGKPEDIKHAAQLRGRPGPADAQPERPGQRGRSALSCKGYYDRVGRPARRGAAKVPAPRRAAGDVDQPGPEDPGPQADGRRRSTAPLARLAGQRRIPPPRVPQAGRGAGRKLREEDRGDEADRSLASLPAAEARDVFIRLTWDGDADFDLVVQEPLGAPRPVHHAAHRLRRLDHQERLRQPPRGDLRLPSRLRWRLHGPHRHDLHQPREPAHPADPGDHHPRGNSPRNRRRRTR